MRGRARLLYYCCPQDTAHGLEFAKHLAPLAGSLEVRDSSQMLAGDHVAAQLDQQVQWAEIVVLLISADFVAMPFYNDLIGKVRRRHGPARIVPVLLRTVAGTGELDGLRELPSNGVAVTKWLDRDEAWVDVVNGIRPLAESIDVEAAAERVWNMPAPTDYFTGREIQVDELRQALLRERRAAIGQVQAVSGLGGIGKTQLALEYAQRFTDQYQAGFFLRAESLHSSLGEMARALRLPPTEPAELLRAVLGWLKAHGPWLLVLDNADTSEALAAIKPLCQVDGKGHVIVTTRLRNTSAIGIARPLRLQVLSPEESQRFLVQRTGREDAGAAELAAAATIAAELDHLPLALEQAGAYIAEREVLFSRYLWALRLRQQELLKERPVAGDHPDPVATTWAINMQQVRETSPIAAVVMELSAFLDPDAIPEELLLKGCEKLEPELAAALGGPAGELALDDALAPLLRYSLIERQPEQRTYSIHRLVQQVIRANLAEPAERKWAERVVRALEAVFPWPEFNAWGQCERLAEQAKTAFALIGEWALAFPEAARLLQQAAYYLRQQAQSPKSRGIGTSPLPHSRWSRPSAPWEVGLQHELRKVFVCANST